MRIFIVDLKSLIQEPIKIFDFCGWIAIAPATLGGYMPLGTFLASLLFGAVNALAIYLASLQIPSEFITLIPYLVTVIALTIYSAQALKKRTRKVGEAKRVGKISESP